MIRLAPKSCLLISQGLKSENMARCPLCFTPYAAVCYNTPAVCVKKGLGFLKEALAFVAAVLLLSTSVISASAHHSGKINRRYAACISLCGCGVPFVCVDRNGDDLCDACGVAHCQSGADFVDDNNDGVCENYATESCGKGRGNGCGRGNGNGRGRHCR